MERDRDQKEDYYNWGDENAATKRGGVPGRPQTRRNKNDVKILSLAHAGGKMKIGYDHLSMR